MPMLVCLIVCSTPAGVFVTYPIHTYTQNDIIYFHDPWLDANGPQRFADIQTFWANIRPYSHGVANAFPAVPPSGVLI